MNTLSIPVSNILHAIHAHTALMAVGSRNRPPSDIPAILHDDHDAVLTRVARDAAAVLLPQLAAAGISGVSFSEAPPEIVFSLSRAVGDVEPFRPPLEQAIKYMVLHIAYTAAGLHSDYRLLALDAVSRLNTASPATITPWP